MLGRCYFCNKEFELSEEQEEDFIKNLNYQYFCKDECKNEFNNIMNRFNNNVSENEESKKEYNIYKFLRTCPTCNKEFELNYSQKNLIKKDPNHKCYCSHDCYIQDIKNKRTIIIYRNCPICGKRFKLSYDQRSSVKKDPNHKCFCSKSCSRKYKNYYMKIKRTI